MKEKHRQTLLEGVAILGFTAFLSKLLGAVYRIPFQNIAGDLGLAVYNKVYPLYSMVLILATAGFPVAISKLVAEEIAKENHLEAKRILKVSIYLLSSSSLVLFLFLYFASPLIARLMGNSGLELAIRSVSFALLFVPIMAALRGYFQGYQNMNPTAYSQITEQTVRVATILTLAYILMGNPKYGVYYAGAGAVLGATTGAIAGLIVLLVFWRGFKSQFSKELLKGNGAKKSIRQIVKGIFYYSLPIAIGSLIYPLFGVVDSFSISNLLQHEGLSIDASESLFGVYTRGQPLIQFATFFAPSFSLALVPAISDALVRKQHKQVQEYIVSALRFTILVGFPASIGLASLASPINIFFYKDDIGTIPLAILAFTVLFSAVVIVSTGILNGMGKIMLPAKYLLLGVVLKAGLNFLLVPTFGINGAALATVIAYAVSAVLNLWVIRSEYQTGYRISFLIRVCISGIIMFLFVLLTRWVTFLLFHPYVISDRILMGIITIVTIIVGIITYLISLFITGSIKRSDIIELPKYGQRIIRLLGRLRLMKYLKD